MLFSYFGSGSYLSSCYFYGNHSSLLGFQSLLFFVRTPESHTIESVIYYPPRSSPPSISTPELAPIDNAPAEPVSPVEDPHIEPSPADLPVSVKDQPIALHMGYRTC